MKLLSLFFVTAAFLFAAEQDEVPLLRWAGPKDSKPGTYEEWKTQHPYTNFSYILDKIIPGKAGTVAILTEQNIALSLTDEINQLANNLQSEGYTILSYQISGGTPETLRTFLQNLYNINGIEGALLIGNLPVAWFEIKNDFGQYGYAEFPIDLFYMDLNGIWLDTMNTGNGKYDGHTGNIDPEIYIGRLLPKGLGNDTLLLKNYFRKDNAYRHDTLLLTPRALVFVDDDWIPWAPQWAQDISLLYPDTMNYWYPETTRASVYRIKLDTTQTWVSVFAHSWPGGHQFTYNNGSNYDNYYSYEYTNQDPPANFYNFFACSFCRYTEMTNCGGSRSIFNQTSGIGAIGSTKTGSMLDFYYFYLPLSQGKTVGTAFQDWFTHITSNGVTFDELCWHYGMTLFADPWLKPVGHHTPITEFNADLISPQEFNILCNPVSTQINLAFSLNKSKNVKIFIYDGTGRKVATLMNNKVKAGSHTLSLLLKDRYGDYLPRGIYILRIEIGREIITKKIVKI